jgi:hypothetical protein
MIHRERETDNNNWNPKSIYWAEEKDDDALWFVEYTESINNGNEVQISSRCFKDERDERKRGGKSVSMGL